MHRELRPPGSIRMSLLYVCTYVDAASKCSLPALQSHRNQVQARLHALVGRRTTRMFQKSLASGGQIDPAAAAQQRPAREEFEEVLSRGVQQVVRLSALHGLLLFVVVNCARSL